MDNLIEAYNWTYEHRRVVSLFVVLFGMWGVYMVITSLTKNGSNFLFKQSHTMLGVILVMCAVCIWVGLAVLLGWT